MTKLTKTLITGVHPVFTLKARSRHFDLPRNPLFASLSRQQLRLILPYLKQKEFRHNRPILEEGRRNASKIYIIISGQVSVAKQGLSPIEDRITTYEIGELRRGNIFGEVSFIDGKPSAVTYLAKSDVTLAVVDLSTAKWRPSARRVRNIVIAKLRHHLASRAHETITLQLESLRRENEFVTYRSGVGHIVVTTLCLLSFYMFALSFLPSFKSFAHGNIALSPLIILLFALSFIPIIATSGFSLRFFGLRLDNWREALSFSMQASAIFLCGFLAAKWLLIKTDPSFAGLALIDGARIEIEGHSVPLTGWYWLALVFYLLLTPMQEFVARSGLQAPLYAFLHGSEVKRRWCSIMVSNLVFSAAHVHISLGFALAVFLPGLLWGWIFARTHSLLAATVSHLLVGGAAIFLFGIEGIVAKLAA